MAKNRKNDNGQGNRIQYGTGEYKCWCAACFKEFSARRSDATYCSSKCRTRASRDASRAVQASHIIDGMQFQIRGYVNAHRKDKYIYAALVRLYAMIGTLIKQFEDDNV